VTPTELDVLVAITLEAAALVRSVYARPFDVRFKGPSDPVTEADLLANELLCTRLEQSFPGIPVVAEESPPERFVDFRSSERIFFVDPVDGTNEFIDRNGQFVVMLGLVEGDRAVASVISAPDTGVTWVGHVGHGAYRLEADGSRRAIHVSDVAELADSRVVSSRSHRTPALERALGALGARAILALGSAGLKGASVAEGSSDLYVAPHYAGKRWDVCPTDALVVAAGGNVTDAQGRRIDYRAASLVNDLGMVVSNGRVHAAAVERLEHARTHTPS